MHPTSKLVSQGYTSSQRILDITGSGAKDVVAEMDKFADILTKTRKLGFDDLMANPSDETVYKTSEGIEANSILEKLTDVRIRGLDLLDKIREEINDPEKAHELSVSFNTLKDISANLLTVARSTHEQTKNMVIENDNQLSM